MNKTRLREVARNIEANPDYYDQSTYCGSACCIAGWAIWLYGTPEEQKAIETGDGLGSPREPKRGKEILGLTYRQATELFCGIAFGNDPQRAAKGLRALANGAHLDEIGL